MGSGRWWPAVGGDRERSCGRSALIQTERLAQLGLVGPRFWRRGISVAAGIWGDAAVSASGDAGGAAGGRTSEGENGWWVGLGGEGISRVGRVENFSGTRGSRFSAQFGSAHMRSWNRASHLDRAEKLFSIEVGTVQNV
jgi:hypothetical protein